MITTAPPPRRHASLALLALVVARRRRLQQGAHPHDDASPSTASTVAQNGTAGSVVAQDYIISVLKEYGAVGLDTHQDR